MCWSLRQNLRKCQQIIQRGLKYDVGSKDAEGKTENGNSLKTNVIELYGKPQKIILIMSSYVNHFSLKSFGA